MVSNTPNSEAGTVTDITYVMPAFAGLPGLQEAARAFSRSGAFSEESQAVRAQLALVADQGVSDAFALVDDDQLGKAKIEALSRVPAGPVGSYSAVQEIVNKIKSSNDPREVMSLSSQLDAAINSTERLKGEEQDPEVQQRVAIDRMMQRIDENNKKIDDIFDKAELTEEEKKRLKEAKENTAEAGQVLKNAAPAERPQALADYVAAVKAQGVVQNDVAKGLSPEQQQEVSDLVAQNKAEVESLNLEYEKPTLSAEKPKLSLAEAEQPSSKKTITLGTTQTKTNDASFAYMEVEAESLGALALQQGGTKDSSPDVGKGGGAGF